MSATGLLRGWLIPTLRRQRVDERAATETAELEAGNLALERGYLDLEELLGGLDRWAESGRRCELLASLVEQGALLAWQRAELEQLLELAGVPPVPWEELGAGD